MRVLIVDDEEKVLMAMRRMLSDCCAVDCAGNAAEALEKTKESQYDFVLLDFNMPKQDGLWFMRNCKLPRKAKIILLTAYLNKQLVKEMFKLGLSSYLMKPVTREDVLRHFECLSKPHSAEQVSVTA